MKINNSTIFASIVLVIFSFFLYKNEKIKLDAIEINKLNNFDLILTKGQSFQSKLISILNLSLNNYSHIGIITKKNNNIFVLHATPDGTNNNCIRYDDLQTFIDLSDVSDYKILRYKYMSLSLLKNLRLAFNKYKVDSVPFDFEFSNYDENKIYCSELIYLIFKNAGIALINKDNLAKPIYPKDFLVINKFNSVN